MHGRLHNRRHFRNITSTAHYDSVMTPRPTRIAQTTKEAKKEYRKHGQRLSETQQRRLERAVELDQRAARCKSQAERRAELKQKREEREKKERNQRRQLGVGLATQLIGFSHTQAQLKSGMEAFLGFKKKKEEEADKERELAQKLGTIVEKEPWDDLDDEDLALDDLPVLSVLDTESLIDDELDDDTLLEAHDQIMSDAADEVLEPVVQPLLPKQIAARTATPTRSPQKPAASKEDIEFARLHGPVNKAIENILDRLPQPLIELLSIDTSSNAAAWDPSPYLLHKLNPTGCPPHRLRVKVGCTAIVLRDLNSSSQLSKSSLLRIMRVEQERLECLVLDGQLEGTKTFLTRVPFHAKYRNDEATPFQRLQFPIRISNECHTSNTIRDVIPSSFKPHSIPGQSTKASSGFKKPILPKSKTKPERKANPTFKTPGVPASRALDKASHVYQIDPARIASIDGWDDFLDSATQIARDLSSDIIVDHEIESCIAMSLPFSTQDFDFTLEDLDEQTVQGQLTNLPVEASNREKQQIQDTAIEQRKDSTPSKPRPRQKEVKPTTVPAPRPRLRPGCKPVPRNRGLRPIAKTKTNPPQETRASSRDVKSAATSLASFDEFGLSTQEAVSFFDDDEFPSSTIVV